MFVVSLTCFFLIPLCSLCQDNPDSYSRATDSTIVIAPAKVTGFKGEIIAGAGMQLFWEMPSDQNIRGFIVERSADSSSFSSIAFIKTGENENNFSYIDHTSANAPVFYRLKQVDKDGRAIICGVINCVPKNALIQLYPNPVFGSLTINCKKQIKRVNIYSNEGKLMQVSYPDNNSLDVSDLDSGYYNVVITFMDGQKATERLYKK